LKVSPANLFLSVDRFPDFSYVLPNIPKRIFGHRGFYRSFLKGFSSARLSMPYIIRLVGRAGFEPATIRFPRCVLGRLGDAYLWQASTASPSAWTRVKLARKLYQAELPPDQLLQRKILIYAFRFVDGEKRLI